MKVILLRQQTNKMFLKKKSKFEPLMNDAMDVSYNDIVLGGARSKINNRGGGGGVGGMGFNKKATKMILDGVCYVGIPDSEKVWKITEREKELLRKRKIPKSLINRHPWVRRCKCQIDNIVDEGRLINIPMKYEHEGPKNKDVGIVADVFDGYVDINKPLQLRFKARARPGKEELARSLNSVSLKFFVQEKDNKGLIDELSITKQPDDEECKYVVSESSKDNLYGRIESITYEDEFGNVIYYEGNKNGYPCDVMTDEDSRNYNVQSGNEILKLNNLDYIINPKFNSKFNINPYQGKQEEEIITTTEHMNYQGGGGGNWGGSFQQQQQQQQPQQQFSQQQPQQFSGGNWGGGNMQSQMPTNYSKQGQSGGYGMPRNGNGRKNGNGNGNGHGYGSGGGYGNYQQMRSGGYGQNPQQQNPQQKQQQQRGFNRQMQNPGFQKQGSSNVRRTNRGYNPSGYMNQTSGGMNQTSGGMKTQPNSQGGMFNQQQQKRTQQKQNPQQQQMGSQSPWGGGRNSSNQNKRQKNRMQAKNKRDAGIFHQQGNLGRKQQQQQQQQQHQRGGGGSGYNYGIGQLNPDQMRKMLHTKFKEEESYARDNLDVFEDVYNDFFQSGGNSGNRHTNKEDFLTFLGNFMQYRTHGLDQSNPSNKTLRNVMKKFDAEVRKRKRSQSEGQGGGNVYQNDTQFTKRRNLGGGNYEGGGSADSDLYSGLDQFQGLIGDIGTRFDIGNEQYMRGMIRKDGGMGQQGIYSEQSKEDKKKLEGFGRALAPVSMFFANEEENKVVDKSHEAIPFMTMTALYDRESFSAVPPTYKRDLERYGDVDEDSEIFYRPDQVLKFKTIGAFK